MKSVYECIHERLEEKPRTILEGLPSELKEKLNGIELHMGDDEKLRSSAIDFIAGDIKSTPQRARQTIDRICEFFMASYQGLPPESILEKFKAKFKTKGDKGAEPKDKLNESKTNEEKQVPPIKENAKKIEQQMLFRNFYTALDPKNRERLVDFIVKQKLCDAGLEPELRERIKDGRTADEKEIETFFTQVMKGGLDDFTWMHQMLLALFTSVVSSQDSLVELQREFDAAAKPQPGASAAPPQLLVDAKALTDKYEKAAKEEAERRESDVKMAELQNELKNRDALFAEKLELERSKLETRLLESGCAKQGENFAMQSRLAGNLIARFVKTLPPEHAASGQELLAGIMRDCYGDPGFMQDAESGKAPERQMKEARLEPASKATPGSQVKTHEKKWGSWVLITLAILSGILALLGFITALVFGAWVWQLKAQPPCSQAVVPYQSDGISRLAGVRLDTQEDLVKAYDILKPHATPDEIIFLNARSQAIQNAKDGALPK